MANIRQLAKACGLDPDYTKWTGEPTSSSDPALFAAVQALSNDLGIQLASYDDIRGALADVERNRWDELVPPTVVGWDGSIVVPFSVPAGADGDYEIEVTTESGRVTRAHGKLFGLAADSHAWPAGQVHCIRRASVWLDGELGYHQVEWRLAIAGAPATRGDALGICAPTRAYGGPGGPRRWGVFAPVYGLASQASGEAGDLASLRRLFEAVAARGGRYVATLPILAGVISDAGPSSLSGFSPYSPVSRHFWNELYLDLGKLASDLEMAAPIAPAIQSGTLIDYAHQYRWRRAVLEPFATALLARRGPEIDAWARSTETYDYAAFRAIGETTHLPWSKWPGMWHDDVPMIQSRADAAAIGVEGPRLDTHVAAQWAMQQQLEALTHDSVGLYLDLPVGVSLDAYEVWRHRHLFLTSLAAGAPPDPLFLGGQNWGLPPLSPLAIRRDHYRYVIRCVRHHMRVARMLRIDHVMGLFRLYVVPEGRPATDGVYLRYHAEDLLAILALESTRHRCALVGEDLGTVPDHVRPAMHRHGMFRLHVGQWFLPARVGDRPGVSPHESIAALNTHDTATFAGWWRGADIDDRHDLGLITDAQDTQERTERDQARAALLAFAHHHPRKTPAEDNLTDVERAMVAATADLAAGPAEVMLIALDDLALDPIPHNVPGTTIQRPNWQRRVEGWATALDPEHAAPAAAAAVAAVVSARPS